MAKFAQKSSKNACPGVGCVVILTKYGYKRRLFSAFIYENKLKGAVI